LSFHVNILWNFGNTITASIPHLCYGNIPEIHPLAARVIPGHRRSTKEMT
jgi:hypothetical protein